MADKDGKDREIKIPESVIEALLSSEQQQNHVALKSVCEQILRIAEDQAPDHWKTHRHGNV